VKATFVSLAPEKSRNQVREGGLDRADFERDPERAGEAGEDLVVDAGEMIEPPVHIDPDEGTLHIRERQHDELATGLHLRERGGVGSACAEEGREREQEREQDNSALKRMSHGRSTSRDCFLLVRHGSTKCCQLLSPERNPRERPPKAGIVCATSLRRIRRKSVY